MVNGITKNLNQNTATGLGSVTESETQTWKIISSNHEKTKSAWALTLTDFDHMHYMNTDKIIVFFFSLVSVPWRINELYCFYKTDGSNSQNEQ